MPRKCQTERKIIRKGNKGERWNSHFFRAEGKIDFSFDIIKIALFLIFHSAFRLDFTFFSRSQDSLLFPLILKTVDIHEWPERGRCLRIVSVSACALNHHCSAKWRFKPFLPVSLSSKANERMRLMFFLSFQVFFFKLFSVAVSLLSMATDEQLKKTRNARVCVCVSFWWSNGNSLMRHKRWKTTNEKNTVKRDWEKLKQNRTKRNR